MIKFFEKKRSFILHFIYNFAAVEGQSSQLKPSKITNKNIYYSLKPLFSYEAKEFT